MAEDKEQLKISAELDTSKLKQGAKQGLSEVSGETKKVEQDAKRASKAVDNIGDAGKKVGQSMQQAGQQAGSALKSIGNEAKNTAAQVDNIAKATKQIKFQQALGVANRAISQLAPVGQALGQAAGMSESGISLAGAGISGAMSGAMAGAALGPLGAAGGALLGAATSLISAADELKKSAKTLAEDRRNAYEANIDRFNDYQQNKAWEGHVGSYREQLASGDPQTVARAKEALNKEIATLESEIRGRENLIRVNNQVAKEELEAARRRYADGSEKQSKAVAEIYKTRGKEVEEGLAEIGRLGGKLSQLKGLNGAVDNATKNFNQSIANADEQNALTKERKGLVDAVAPLVNQRRYQEARDLLGEPLAKYREQFEAADARMRDESLSLEDRQKARDERNRAGSQIDFLKGQMEAVSTRERDTLTAERTSTFQKLLSDNNRVGNVKLTDALTRVGGGVGYGAQMSGIADKVTTIAKTLSNILAELKNGIDVTGQQTVFTE